MTIRGHFLVVILQIFWQPTMHSCHHGISDEVAKFPHFDMTDRQSKVEFFNQMHAQAVSSIMAVSASKILHKNYNNEAKLEMEACSQLTNDLAQYARCLRPAWDLGGHKNGKWNDANVNGINHEWTPFHRRKKKESNVPTNLEAAQWEQITGENSRLMEQNIALQKSPIGHMADIFSSLVRQPPNSQAGGGKHPTKFKSRSGRQSKSIMAGTLVETFVNELFEPVDGLLDFIHGDISIKDEPEGDHSGHKTNLEDSITNFIHKMTTEVDLKQTLDNRPQKQRELLNITQQLFLDLRKGAKQQHDSHNMFLLSPRLFPISPQDNGEHFLSPDIFSFNDEPTKTNISNNKINNNANSIAPMEKLLGPTAAKGDRQALRNLIVKISKANEKLQNKNDAYESLVGKMQIDINNSNDSLLQNITVTNSTGSNDSSQLNEKIAKINDVFRKLYQMILPRQVDQMTKGGFAFLTPQQLDIVYGESGLERGKYYFNSTSSYAELTHEDKEQELLKYFQELANEQKLEKHRVKRLVGGSSVLRPGILSPLAHVPIILHPLVLSPSVLSPSVLGPLILSPAVFSPLILSPNVLGGAVLSPFLGDALVLSPVVLFPIILSPLVLDPFILSPSVLSPLVLSPIVLSPGILSPSVLSPIILSPIVLSPSVLSPSVLSPLVDSPVVTAMKMLSPSVMSPPIRSPTQNYTAIMSPSILSKK